MTKDRLSDLRRLQGQQQHDDGEVVHGETVALTVAEEESSFMADFYKEVTDIRKALDEIGIKLNDIRLLHNDIISSPLADDKKKAQLDSLMADIKKRSSRVSERLKDMQKNLQHDDANNGVADTRIRTLQHAALLQRFVDQMNDYNAQQVHYRDQCRERIRRQLIITNQHMSDEELEDKLEKGDFSVFTQSIIIEKQKAEQMLKDIEARHNDIVKLEQSLKELCDLFNDLALLVNSQSEIIDRIEYNVQQTADYVESGKVNLGEAKVKQRSARKKKICIVVCVVVAIIILIIVIALAVALR